MKLSSANLEGVKLLTHDMFSDERGCFFEAFKSPSFQSLGLPEGFLQSNISKSRAGVVRGMHLQSGTFAQGKLVRCLAGSIMDVVLDLRIASKTFGKVETFELNDQANQSIYIPPGFAHGFQALKNETLVQYCCTQVYSPSNEINIYPLDKDLAIAWPLPDVILSSKDRSAMRFKDFQAQSL